MSGCSLFFALASTLSAATSGPVVEIDHARLTLGDVVPGAQGDLAAFDLGPAPRPGKRRVITRGELQKKLRRAFVPAQGLKLPRRITVVRPAVTMSASELRRHLARAIQERLPAGATLKRVLTHQGIVLPRGRLSFRVELERLRSSARQTLSVAVFVGEERYRVLPVTVELEVSRRAREDVVQRGDRVTLVVTAGGVRIEAKGVVQQDARLGEEVPVIAQVARRVVRGIVRSATVVEVRP